MRWITRLVFVCMLVCLLGSSALSQDFPTTPALHNGQKWRIGYLEGGSFPDYEPIFLQTVAGLMELGWIEPIDLPHDYNPDHRQVWEWAADNLKSDYIIFVKDAFYTSGFKEEIRDQTKAELLDRLKTKKDIDLILALGTWAGQDLANTEHSVPTVVLSSSDPVGSKVIKSAEDSGLDHMHAKVEPDRYARQLRLFHDIVGFKTLGIVFEDSPEGRTFAAVSSAETVAKERGFELKTCNARNSNVSKSEAAAEVLQCYASLAPQVDALYITSHRGEALRYLTTLLEPLLQNGVATFAMPGSEFVKHGALLSIAHAGFSYVGRFHAETVAKIFNGALPRQLNQKWNAPPKIAINLKTAERIGFNPPFDILAAADETYDQIEPVPPTE